MTDEQIALKIVRDAEARAAAVMEKAALEAESILKRQREQALADAEKAVAPIVSRMKEEAEAARRQVVAEARGRGNWNVLAEKRRIIDEALTAALNRMTENLRSDPASYGKLLSHLAGEAGAALGGGNLELLVNSHDAHLHLDLVSLSGEVQGVTGAKTNFALSRTTIKNVGGVLVTADEGRRTVDNTFEGILERSRREFEVKASKLLFSD